MRQPARLGIALALALSAVGCAASEGDAPSTGKAGAQATPGSD